MDSFDIGAAAASAKPDQGLSRSLQASFREHHRRRYRGPRAGLYLIFATAFGLSPLGNGLLFSVSPTSVGTVLALSSFVIAPLNFLAFASLLLNAPSRLSGVLQTVAAVASISAALWMRQLDRIGEMHYPIHLFGVIIISLAVFGGYSWRRVLFGTALYTGAETWLALGTGCFDPAEIVDLYGLALMSVIAVTAGYTLERLAGLAWLFSRRASHLARTDALTGLANRLEFSRRFPRMLLRAEQERRAIALMLLDIDHFKRINDENGHLVGDYVLRSVGAALLAVPQQHPLDMTVRFGGEEVLFAWYAVDEAGVRQRAEATLELIRALPIAVTDQDEALHLTASAGITWLTPTAQTTPQAIIKLADELLYDAKAGGRDRVDARAFKAD